MNKAELIEELAQRVKLQRRDCEALIDSFVDIVIEQLQKGNEVTLTGFGSFQPRYRAPRRGVNPQKPSEIIHVPGVTVAKFKTGKALKDALRDIKPAQLSNQPSPEPSTGSETM